MLKSCVWLIGVLGLGLVDCAATGQVIIQASPSSRYRGPLGTIGYVPLKSEVAVSKKVTERPIALWPALRLPISGGDSAVADEPKKAELEGEKTMIPVESYTLAGQAGEFVGWFGIVREFRREQGGGSVRMLVEHRYFDGLVDTHQQLVSAYGAGDFQVLLPAPVELSLLPRLALVRVYGRVSLENGEAVVREPEYVRVWDWGSFAFMDYGKDKSNPKWVALRKLHGIAAYSESPDNAYYEQLLGKRTPEDAQKHATP